ncbi:MAG TPA: peptide chain release factor N(5)-glutamine methyltransferase [Nevskiaceae bacterium]|nr:peptide chain release factor N(5)-glutamine methyltransferase [Nevskiaceae bacterium]
MLETEAAPQAGTEVGAWLRWAAAELAEVSTSPRTDAELIVGCVLEVSRAQLMTHPEWRLNAPQCACATALLNRRRAREPVAYLLGRQEFWGLTLKVSSAVLIPRPETEGVVERGLSLIAPRERPHILDLGAGSGAIALALAHERPDACVVAVERDPAAAEVARTNSRRLGLPVDVRVGDWFAPLQADERFDLLVANPPYVVAGDPALQSAVACYEPAAALYAAGGGLDAFRVIVAGAPRFLRDGAAVAFEHGVTQAQAVCALLSDAGFAEVADDRDLAGLPRVAWARWIQPQCRRVAD